MLDYLMLHLVTLQTILVNSTQVCFLNYTSSNTWQACGLDKDFLTGALVGWQWITGGNFSMILVAIFVMFSYIKYHKVVYPIVIGIFLLPLSYFVFPVPFLNFAFVLVGLAIGILIWYIKISQTSEQ